MADPITQSPNRNYPLPHPDNVSARLDVQRIRDALEAIDTDVANALVGAITQAAVDASIAAAIAGLVDTAPTTLDTLNELAAALGDDPNFAATITAALAGKANTDHTHSDATNAAAGFMTAAQAASLESVAAAIIGVAKLGAKQEWARVQKPGVEDVAFASSWSPDLDGAPYKRMAVLTGAITVGLPINTAERELFTLEFSQDANGYRAISMNAGYINLPTAFVILPNKRMWMDCMVTAVTGTTASQVLILGTIVEPA